MTDRAVSLCPWCNAERRSPLRPDDSYHYVICTRHQRALLVQYAATRRATRASRPARGQAAERASRAA